MTASEIYKFKTAMRAAVEAICDASQVMKETHERSDMTRITAKRLDEAIEQIHDIEDRLLEAS